MRASDEIVRFVPVFLFCLGFAGQGRGATDAKRFSLSWSRMPGAEPCIAGRALARAVEARLHHPVFGGPGESDIGIEGRVERTDAGWHAVVSVVDDRGAVLGTREVSTTEPSCRELDAPLMLIVALFVDPDARDDRDEPSDARVPAAAPSLPEAARSAEPEKDTVPAPQRAPAREEPWRSWAALGGGLSLGTLPEPSAELVLRIGVMPPRGWPVVVSGALLHEATRSPGGDARPVTFSIAEGGVAVCPLHGAWPAGELRACAGLDAGAISTRGLSSADILVRRRLVLMAEGRAEGTLNLGTHAFAVLGAALVVPLLLDHFDYERDGAREPLYRMSPVGAAFDLGLGFRVP